MTEARLERASEHVWWFTPDERTDRPSLGLVVGRDGSYLLEPGASEAHLQAFLDALAPLAPPPLVEAVATHWHWDHAFGASLLDVPLAGHPDTAAELRRQASYAWSDDALDARVADGTEIAFCVDMIRIELPDRSGLRIVAPTLLVPVTRTVDLGGVTVELHHVGGDHATDSTVAYVPEDGLLFLGDAHYGRLYAPEYHYTEARLAPLLDRLAAFAPRVAIEGHGTALLDADGFARSLGALRDGLERWRAGDDPATIADEERRETVEALAAGAAALAAGWRPHAP